MGVIVVDHLTTLGIFFLEAFCNISHRLGGITPFGVFSDAFPGLKMWATFACATAKFLTHFIISIAVLENVPPDAGLQKTTETGNQTQATCLAGSVTRRSAIHYAFTLRIVKLIYIFPAIKAVVIIEKPSRQQWRNSSCRICASGGGM
jgi:hypothetical protein